MNKIPEDIKQLSFERALAELEEIVDNLESGSVDLEKSIESYTRGSLLRLHCQSKLDEAAKAAKKKAKEEDICIPIGEGENCW